MKAKVTHRSPDSLRRRRFDQPTFVIDLFIRRHLVAPLGRLLVFLLDFLFGRQRMILTQFRMDGERRGTEQSLPLDDPLLNLKA